MTTLCAQIGSFSRPISNVFTSEMEINLRWESSLHTSTSCCRSTSRGISTGTCRTTSRVHGCGTKTSTSLMTASELFSRPGWEGGLAGTYPAHPVGSGYSPLGTLTKGMMGESGQKPREKIGVFFQGEKNSDPFFRTRDPPLARQMCSPLHQFFQCLWQNRK